MSDFLSQFSDAVVVPPSTFEFEFSRTCGGVFYYNDVQYELFLVVTAKPSAVMYATETAHTLNDKVKSFIVHGDIPGKLITNRGWIECE